MVPIAIASVAIALNRLLRRQGTTKEALIVAQATDYLAAHRRDAVLVVEHIALALLEDPSVRALLNANLDIDAFRKALTKTLDERPRLEKGKAMLFDERAHRVLEDAKTRHIMRRMTPRDILWSILLRDTGFARDWLCANGITLEALPAFESRSRTSAVERADVADRPASDHPYRVGDASRDLVRVIFVNDAKTQVPFVIDVLMTELNTDIGAACHLTATVDVCGEAVVASMPRIEAESVVSHIKARARNAGFPLVVQLREPGEIVANVAK